MTRAVDDALPAAFGAAWRDAHRGALARLPVAAAGLVATAWSAIATACRGVREPHIEWPEGELRYTWNRDGHYLELSLFGEGRLEWFYGQPQRAGGDSVGGNAMDEGFFAALAAIHSEDATEGQTR